VIDPVSDPDAEDEVPVDPLDEEPHPESASVAVARAATAAKV
jgi:hypothetical protein